MVTRSVFGVVKTRGQAAAIIKDVSRAGFSTNDVSVLVPDTQDGTAPATLGPLTGLTSVEIPGLRPMSGAGPIIAMLAGWSTGGVAHGLVSLHIPEHVAQQFERKIGNGNILLVVQATEPKDVARLEAIMLQHQLEDVTASDEREVSAINARPSRPPAVIPL